MKWTKWTPELIRKIASECPNVRHFHHYHRGAEKAAKRLGINDSLFPNKEIHSTAYTVEQVTQEATKYSKRAQFQLNNPSMYNAAKKFNILNTLFPIQLNRRYTDEELIQQASKYKTIKEWEAASNGSYQVASRRGIVASHGPKPSQGVSEAELELLSWLRSLGLDFKTKRFGNEYELDCYSESLKLGIEYNGLFWHSDINKPKNYHLNKTKYFEKLGIRVIHVWEHEWRDRKDQVKNYLSSACKVNQTRLGARKCQFLEITPLVAKKFLSDNHIQGAAKNIKLAVGIFYQNKLISVATFGNHHRQGFEGVKVLNRFACLPGFTISGGLAKASRMAYVKLGKLISWAHYAKSQGKGYLAAGWTQVKTHPPDYFYATPQGVVISKQSRRKSSVGTPDHMTEHQHALQDGLYRIWDCGKILLQYSPDTVDPNQTNRYCNIQGD
jgi:very-short-patch-repair endonuclease